jgi:hypothetical protein
VWPSTESPSRTSANMLGGKFALQVVLVVQASFGFETVGGDLGEEIVTRDGVLCVIIVVNANANTKRREKSSPYVCPLVPV